MSSSSKGTVGGAGQHVWFNCLTTPETGGGIHSYLRSCLIPGRPFHHFDPVIHQRRACSWRRWTLRDCSGRRQTAGRGAQPRPCGRRPGRASRLSWKAWSIQKGKWMGGRGGRNSRTGRNYHQPLVKIQLRERVSSRREGLAICIGLLFPNRDKSGPKLQSSLKAAFLSQSQQQQQLKVPSCHKHEPSGAGDEHCGRQTGSCRLHKTNGTWYFVHAGRGKEALPSAILHHSRCRCLVAGGPGHTVQLSACSQAWICPTTAALIGQMCSRPGPWSAPPELPVSQFKRAATDRENDVDCC